MKKLIALGMTSLFLVGCSEPTPQEKATLDNQNAIAQLIANDPIPIIERSLERENIKRRIEFINQPNRVGYLYLLSENGQLIKEVTVQGKASSLNSYLTPMEEPLRGSMMNKDGEFTGSQYDATVVSSADIDGTWGENDNGIFWFTPDGVYQEWTGLYLYSSERMSFDVKPVLMEVSE